MCAPQSRPTLRRCTAAYNSCVPSLTDTLLLPALSERALLLLNHVLLAEPAAGARLRPHAGRHIAVRWLAAAGPWPTPPELLLRVTPAGLFEQADAAGAAAPADLRVSVELPAPHRLLSQWLTGERPRLTVEGDAQFAADIAWLSDNLSWDLEHDLARLVGDAAAHQLVGLGASLREALRGLAQRAADAWAQRPGARSAASQ